MFTKSDFWLVLGGALLGVVNYVAAKAVFGALLGLAYLKFGLACGLCFLLIVVGWTFYWLHSSSSPREYDAASMLTVISIFMLAGFAGMFFSELSLMPGPWF